MNLNEIKKEALEFKGLTMQMLSIKVSELKVKGVGFLGCVAFVQTNQQLSLSEARKMTLKLDCWSEEERKNIDFHNQLMMSEFDEAND